nr:DMT family transporter [Anaerocolumna cellulosilytica]
MIYLLLSMLSGVTLVIARIINSNLAARIGTYQGTLVNYIVGLFFSLLFFLINKEAVDLSYVHVSSIPFWAYLGGLGGVIIIVASNYLTPKISAFYLTLLLFVGQLFVGIIIDYLLLQEFSTGKLIGGILVALGLTYNLFLDKKTTLKTE